MAEEMPSKHFVLLVEVGAGEEEDKGDQQYEEGESMQVLEIIEGEEAEEVEEEGEEGEAEEVDGAARTATIIRELMVVMRMMMTMTISIQEAVHLEVQAG